MTLLIRLSLMVTIGAALATAGCANNYGSVPLNDTPNTANTTPAVRVADDFPIPAGSTVVTGDTLILGTGNNWTGRLVLELSGDGQSAFVFFRDQGKAFGWKLVAASYGKVSLLTLTKSQRSATVYIQDSFRGSSATITVSPVAVNN